MVSVTFSQLRNSAKKYFDAVERGQTIEVYRKGKPVAIVMPAKKGPLKRWKVSSPLRLSGASLSRAILAEREEA